VSDLTEIPDALRAGLPEELKDAELAGADVAGADESCRLYGPPGAGKSTQSAFRAGTLATEEGLKPSDMTVVTYRKALAGVVRNRLIDWGVFEAPDVDPEKADSATRSSTGARSTPQRPARRASCRTWTAKTTTSLGWSAGRRSVGSARASGSATFPASVAGNQVDCVLRPLHLLEE